MFASVNRPQTTLLTWACAALLCLAAAASAGAAQAARRGESAPSTLLSWNTEKGVVDANVSSAELLDVLEEIAEATGWRVYVDPGAVKRTVSTKFKGRKPDKALDLLLGNLGRVLLPGTNGGPSRLLVFRTSEKEATRLVNRPVRKNVKPIPNELLVRLKPGSKMEALAKKLGAKILGQSESMNGYRLGFEDADAANAARKALEQEDDVRSIDPNFTVEELPVPSGGVAGGLNFRLNPGKDGENLVIGLIDSAVQRQGGRMDEFLLPTISLAGESTPTADRPTHGTSMFQTLMQGLEAGTGGAGASNVRVLPVDVYGNNPTTTTFEVAAGVVQAVNDGAKVLSLSLGTSGDTPFLHDVIRQAADLGIVIVAAAGNEPTTAATYPAAYPETVAVTAGSADGQIAPYANRGDFVDVIAPGTFVVTHNGQTWRVTGTSGSTALFSGFVAGIADANKLTPQQARVEAYKRVPAKK
jgi:hypothetical protein